MKIIHLALGLALLTLTAALVRADVPPTYNDVMFQPQGVCTDAGHMKFRKLGMAYTDSIGKTADGHDILVDTLISLFHDGTYFFHYVEYEVAEADTPRAHPQPLFAKDFQGKWHMSPVAPDQLDLEGDEHKLAVALLATQMQIGNQRMIALAFMPGFEREQARSHQIFTAAMFDTKAGYGETAQKYCEKPY